MKSVPVFFIVFGLVWIHCLDALAQEQTTRLPEDGWWIRYRSMSKRGTAGKLTYSLVGTVMEDGETFRWIELNTVFPGREMENVVTWKFLVKEKDFLEREQPLEAIKRGWRKANKLDVHAIKVGPSSGELEDRLMIFPGAWQKADRADTEKVVDYQHGRLTIPQALLLNVTKPLPAYRIKAPVNEEYKEVFEYTSWFDPKSAPVFSAAKIRTKIFANDKLKSTSEVELTIEDTGIDAKSQLPESN